MTTRGGRRARKVALVCALAAAAVVGLVWLQNHRVDPRTIGQDQLHRIATTGKGGSLDGVKPHPVTVSKSEVGAGQLVSVYVARLIARNPDTAVQGRFDSRTGKITILGNESCFDASLPGRVHPLFYHSLRHEYGHAAMADWLKSNRLNEVAQAQVAMAERTKAATPKGCPRSLVPVVCEWKSQKPTVYGPRYFTETFTEYLAESYARYLEGRKVPPQTAKFLQTAYR